MTWMIVDWAKRSDSPANMAVLAEAKTLQAKVAARIDSPPEVIMDIDGRRSKNEKGEVIVDGAVCFGPGKHHYILLPKGEPRPSFHLTKLAAIIGRASGRHYGVRVGDLAQIITRDGTYKFYPTNVTGEGRDRKIKSFHMTITTIEGLKEVKYWSEPLSLVEREG